MRHPREAVEGDVVAPRVARELFQYLAAKRLHLFEVGCKGVHCRTRALDQEVDLRTPRCGPRAILRAGGIFTSAVVNATLLDLTEPVVHRLDQRGAPVGVLQQIVVQVGIARHHPDVAEYLVQHARRASGAPFLAQVEQRRPGILAKQADHDLPVGERGVVVGDFA